MEDKRGHLHRGVTDLIRSRDDACGQIMPAFCFLKCSFEAQNPPKALVKSLKTTIKSGRPFCPYALLQLRSMASWQTKAPAASLLSLLTDAFRSAVNKKYEMRRLALLR